MTLISLEESNRIQTAKYYSNNTTRRNGIACPKCGEELLDTKPDVILLTAPPQLNIHCPNCDYRGYRIK